MAGKQSKATKIGRNAIDGRFTTVAFALSHPTTTVVETQRTSVKKPSEKPKPRVRAREKR